MVRAAVSGAATATMSVLASIAVSRCCGIGIDARRRGEAGARPCRERQGQSLIRM